MYAGVLELGAEMKRINGCWRVNDLEIFLAFLLGVFLTLLMSGCQVVLEHSERELADHQKTLQIARNRIPVVTDQICFVKGLGVAEELSVKAVGAMDEFLEMTADPNTMTDCELVYSLGLGGQFYKASAEYFVPELSRYWP